MPGYREFTGPKFVFLMIYKATYIYKYSIFCFLFCHQRSAPAPGPWIPSPPTFLRTLVQDLSFFFCIIIFFLPTGHISALGTLTLKTPPLTLHLLWAMPPLLASLHSKTSQKTFCILFPLLPLFLSPVYPLSVPF